MYLDFRFRLKTMSAVARSITQSSPTAPPSTCTSPTFQPAGLGSCASCLSTWSFPLSLCVAVWTSVVSVNRGCEVRVGVNLAVTVNPFDSSNSADTGRTPDRLRSFDGSRAADSDKIGRMTLGVGPGPSGQSYVYRTDCSKWAVTEFA
jgi:hypothetical protein